MAARSRETMSQPVASDVYVGLLLISLLAQIAGVVFFYLDYSSYPSTAPPKVPAITSASPPPTGGAMPPAAPPGGGAVPPAAPPGGMPPGGMPPGGMPPGM